jgi:hypothetical protein
MTKEQLFKEAAQKRKGLIETARQMKLVARSAAQEEAGGRPIADDDLGERLCIDKAWDALDYLLCRVADAGRTPFDLAILGGEEIGGDHGYGPARYLEVAQVRAVAQALSTVAHETLRQRYAPAAMSDAKVYPGRWDDPSTGDNLDWLLQAFDELLRFYKSAADLQSRCRSR